MAGETLRWFWILGLFYSCSSQFMSFDDYIKKHEPKKPTVYVSSAPRFVFLAPNPLRMDSKENVYLEAQGLTDPVRVTISVYDFPRKALRLLEETVELNRHNNFRTLKAIELSSNILRREDTKNKFVHLQASFGDYSRHEEVVMVTFHKGYIFIQTDKPIYNPEETVMFRYFASSPAFQSNEDFITVQIENPEGVTVQKKTAKAMNGVFPDNYKLSNIVTEGIWKVTAKFDQWEQNTFKAEFEVKKYVLPAFNVTLTPKQRSLNVDDSELEVEVLASYLYGEVVKGTAYVVFGVEIDNHKMRLPGIKQITDLDKGIVTLTMEEIKAVHRNIKDLVGKSIYIKASVLTESGSDLVEAMHSGIKIVDSSYVISFTNTQKYFKPGLPFLVMLQVSHQDGSPAENIPIRITCQETRDLVVSSGTLRTSITMPTEDRQQTITVETRVDDLRPEQQAKQLFTVSPFTPFDKQKQNLLYISTSDSVVSMGSTLTLEATVSAADPDHRQLIAELTYLVLAKTGILSAERLNMKDHLKTTATIIVTKEMMPSFRIVAFYTIPWAGRTEVVADSVWVDVRDTCVGGLSVGSVPGSLPASYQPKNEFIFQVRGDPGARVSLVAVDNAVYLLNKQRLTQKKLWSVVEQRDRGCTKGGGQNSMKVFTDAGLLFLANNVETTGSERGCSGSSRRKRSAELLKRKAYLEKYYKEQLQRRCCMDGVRSVPMPYSCTRRSLFITEGWEECVVPFRHCCSHYWGQYFDRRRPATTTLPPTTTTTPRIHPDFEVIDMGFEPASRWQVMFLERAPHVGGRGMEARPGLQGSPRVEDEGLEADEVEDYLDESQVGLRSLFYESWMWVDKDLPSTPDGGARDGLASLTMTQVLPDSITEWGVFAISGSSVTGFCVADPYNVKTYRPFFVDLRLPHSIARNEHVEIKAVVHNYLYRDLEARVVLAKTEKICSVAFNDKHAQDVKVPARSSVVVPYTLVPLVAGMLPLEVAMLVKDFPAGDRVQKKLHVVVEGVERTKVQSFILDPSTRGDGVGKQVVQVEKVDLTSLVPNSKPETRINIRGNLMADSIENSLSSDSLASLIRMPGGCVEQNLASMTLPLIATRYLDHSKDWEGVGVQRRAEALGYISRGYERQLMYAKRDNSYPPYKNEGTSTWITAYVVKVLSMASPMVRVSEQHVCGPLLYLLDNKQTDDGAFREDNTVYDTSMTGAMRGSEAQATLTAFVSIALSETKTAGLQCGPLVDDKISKTTTYLSSILPRMRRPYTVAIISYALSLTGQSDASYKEHLLKAAAPGGSHWPDSDNHLFTLEATGYALLALVRSGSQEAAVAPFRWLNEQRGIGGGYGSTQPTLVVLQALSEYLFRTPPPPDPKLLVDIKVPGRSDLKYHFDSESAYLTRSSKAPLDQSFSVEARGQGQGVLEVVTYYNELPDVTEKNTCEHFDLSVTLDESSEKPPADALKAYTLTINVRSLNPRQARMVVLDISLPSGFNPENADLERLTNSVDRYVNNYQVVDNLRDRASLILHLFKVSNTETDTISFRINQIFKVSHLQPSPVYIYEYYNPGHNCTRFYSPREKLEDLARVCTNDVCRCTQGDCCVAKSDTQTIPVGARETQACVGLQHIYKVKVLGVTLSQYVKYDMEVTDVIKLGGEQGVQRGQRRTFLSHSGCQAGLKLEEGSEYLIIGPMTDLWFKDKDTGSNVYMLGKNTWVERWPSPSECSSDAQLRCSELSQACNEIRVKGCQA